MYEVEPSELVVDGGDAGVRYEKSRPNFRAKRVDRQCGGGHVVTPVATGGSHLARARRAVACEAVWACQWGYLAFVDHLTRCPASASALQTNCRPQFYL